MGAARAPHNEPTTAEFLSGDALIEQSREPYTDTKRGDRRHADMLREPRVEASAIRTLDLLLRWHPTASSARLADTVANAAITVGRWIAALSPGCPEHRAVARHVELGHPQVGEPGGAVEGMADQVDSRVGRAGPDQPGRRGARLR